MLDFLLRLSELNPAVRMERIRREELSEPTLRELHAMSTRLMAEDLEHFRVHAQANEVVHVFRRAGTGSIIGFQFWRTAPLGLPRSRVILGGKLNIYMTPETLGRYPPAFFEKPAARRYASANPEFRTNGSYVGMWFRFTPANLLSLTRAIARRLLRAPASG